MPAAKAWDKTRLVRLPSQAMPTVPAPKEPIALPARTANSGVRPKVPLHQRSLANGFDWAA